MGAVVFLLGIGVLVFVFAVAYRMFTSPVTIGETAKNSAGVTAAVISLVARIASLLIMVIVGSLVAGKGVQMYAALHPREDGGSKQ